jgi:hypothetical protein
LLWCCISLTIEKYLEEIDLLLHSQNSFSRNWLWVCQASILEGAEILFSSMSETFVALKAPVQCGPANPYLGLVTFIGLTYQILLNRHFTKAKNRLAAAI